MGVNTKRGRGRPPSKDKKELVAVEVLFTREQLELLDRRVQSRGLTRSAHMRLLALEDVQAHGAASG